jgi:soluble lytic murein transglycosylase
MKSSHALLAIAAAAFLGLAAGLIASGTGAGSSPLAFAARWGSATVGMWDEPSRTQELEHRLRDLEERNVALTTLQKQLDTLETRDDWSDGARAYTEAKRLGILQLVAENQPELGPSKVRRMGMAIVAEARKNELDPLLLTALAHVESRFNPFATSGQGALGVFQLTPPTGRTMATASGSALTASAELYDIETNVALGARYLAQLVRQFATVDAALLAYNRGIGGAKVLLRSENGRRALRGYPREVLSERDRLAERAARLHDGVAAL